MLPTRGIVKDNRDCPQLQVDIDFVAPFDAAGCYWPKAEARSFRKPDTLATAIWKTVRWKSDILNHINRHSGQW